LREALEEFVCGGEEVGVGGSWWEEVNDLCYGLLTFAGVSGVFGQKREDLYTTCPCRSVDQV